MPVQSRVSYKRGSYFSGKAFARRGAAASKKLGSGAKRLQGKNTGKTRSAWARNENASAIQSMRLSGFTPAMMRGALKEMGVRGRHGVPKSTRKGGGSGSRSEAARKAWQTRRGH